jgi:hypothetical protein
MHDLKKDADVSHRYRISCTSLIVLIGECCGELAAQIAALRFARAAPQVAKALHRLLGELPRCISAAHSALFAKPISDRRHCSPSDEMPLTLQSFPRLHSNLDTFPAQKTSDLASPLARLI